MKIGLLCCWSNMRIYPIYSFHLQQSLEVLTENEVPVITTNCMCFDKRNPVNEYYEFINIPYLTRRPSRTRLKHLVRSQLYAPLEYLRGRSFASRANDFDVVDFQQSSYAFGYEALKSFLSSSSRAKKIVTIHKLDQIQKDNPELNRVYNKADGVITFSEYMREALIKDGVESDKVFSIYHGTSLPALEEVQKDQLIIFCGSPIPQIKGFEHYVVALRLLKENGVQLRTKIYGFFMGDEKEYAVRLATEQGVANLLEWQSFSDESELIAEHQKSLVCVIPYTGYAGYFPAAHAMGNAVPVVATDILGHVEYVSGAGLMVPPASPEKLASAIGRLLADESLRKELGACGRQRAEQTLSWENVATQTLDVFGKVLEER